MKALALRIVVVATCLLSLSLPTPIQATTILNEIDTLDAEPYRILPGMTPDEYWIVDKWNGLILLKEDPPGTWTTEYYPIDRLFDACGPDSRGYIYCCVWPWDADGTVAVFDSTATPPSVIETVNLGGRYIVSGAELSPDESSLYVIGTDWGGPSYESGTHPDTGIIWELDLTSPGFPVINQGVLPALPQSLIYIEPEYGPDRLFVYCIEREFSVRPYASKLEVLEIAPGFPHLTQLIVPFAEEYIYHNPMVFWDQGETLIALSNPYCYEVQNDPRYKDGLWLIDTTTDTIVQTITVLESHGVPRGAGFTLISQAHPGWVYVCLGLGTASSEISIIDHDTGAYIGSVDTEGYPLPYFIHELADGRLIATCGHRNTILIIDPEG